MTSKEPEIIYQLKFQNKSFGINSLSAQVVFLGGMEEHEGQTTNFSPKAGRDLAKEILGTALKFDFISLDTECSTFFMVGLGRSMPKCTECACDCRRMWAVLMSALVTTLTPPLPHPGKKRKSLTHALKLFYRDYQQVKHDPLKPTVDCQSGRRECYPCSHPLNML